MKKGFVGPGRCSLCKSDLEDCLHLFTLCPFASGHMEEVVLSLGDPG